MDSSRQQCKNVAALLPAYLENGLPQKQEAGRVEAHLQACPACRRLCEELQQTAALLSRLPAVQAPADLKSRILARLDPANHDIADSK